MREYNATAYELRTNVVIRFPFARWDPVRIKIEMDLYMLCFIKFTELRSLPWDEL